MDIKNYLWPENFYAVIVVYALLGICAFWLLTYIWSIFQLWRIKSQLNECKDISTLSKSLVEIITEKQESEKKSKKSSSKKKDEEEEAPKQNFIDRGVTAFKDYCKAKSLNSEGPVAKHLKTIFNAGLEDSRLDVGELIKHTSQGIFRINTLLKSVLASFLVIGLLGTLIGLADSLAGLSPVLGKGMTDRTSADLASGLSVLFKHLKTAFAPSILGVATTVLGVLFYSFYLHIGCTPLRNLLQELTLSVWVPRLYLTRSQRWLGTLKFGEEQIQKNIVAINNVIEMQKTIRPDVEELTDKLRHSNVTLGKMNESAAELHNFTNSFTEGVTKLSSFQEHLQTLYQKMIENSEGFQARVQQSIENSQAFQNEANLAFDRQNTQLEVSYRQLKAYEDSYIKEREQIDAGIQKVLEAAQKAYENMATRNEEVLQAIGGPLTEKLKEIETSINYNLDDISKRFNSFDVPLKGAAEKVAMSVVNFDQRTTAVTNELKSQFAAYSEKSDASVSSILEKIDGFADHLSDTNRGLADRSGVLATGVEGLSEKLNALNDSIKMFDRYLHSKTENVDDHLSQMTKELQKEFSRQNQNTTDNLEKLISRLAKYDDQVTETNRRQSDQVENLGKNLSAFSASINDLQGAVKVLESSFQKRDESVESLKPLSDLSTHMEALIGQLKENSQAQEHQNQLVAKNVDQMAGAVKFLAKSMEQLGMKKLAKEYTDKLDMEPLSKNGGIRGFFRRLFGMDRSNSERV